MSQLVCEGRQFLRAGDNNSATDTAKLMAEAGLTPPKVTTKTFVVMGKVFDPAKPEEYLKSFKIKKAV